MRKTVLHCTILNRDIFSSNTIYLCRILNQMTKKLSFNKKLVTRTFLTETMYNILAIIFITSCVLNVQGGPITQNTKSQISVYGKLLEFATTKCPYLKTTKLLEPNPQLLETCSDYNTVKSITHFNQKTSYDVPCLLYYNNFVLLCNDITKVNQTAAVNNNTIDTALKSYDLKNACLHLKGAELIPEFRNASEAIMNATKNSYTCEKICSGFNDNTVTPICSLAAYTVNLTRWIEKVISKSNHQDVEVKPKAAVAAKPKDPVAPKAPVDTPTKPRLLVNNLEPNKQAIEGSHKSEHQILPPHPVVQAKTKPDPRKEAVESPPVSQPKPPQVQDESLQDHQVSNDVEKVEAKNPKLKDEAKVKPDNSQPNVDTQYGNVEQPIIPQQVGPPPDLNVEDHDDAPPNDNQDTQQPKDDTKSNVDDQKPNVESSVSEKTTNTVQEPKVEEDAPDNELGEARDFDANIPQDFQDDDDSMPPEPVVKKEEKAKTNTKPQETDEDVVVPAYSNNPNTDEEDSFFFIYFMMVCAVFILGYIGYHNKQKVLALVIEGRRGRRGSRRGRPNSANYHKLDSNLEEAVTSSCNKNTTNIIY